MLLRRFQRYVQEHGLCTPQDRVLLAVSGGVDSMVMMSLFSRSGYRFAVAHCNFQLRGAEADEDDVVVERAARGCKVPFHAIRFDTRAEVARTGESEEMACRRLRYDWFDKLCAEHGYTHIAIAHHADDSAETFFINLLRGTGLRGLTGIKVVNGRLIRPLLFSLRRDILDYAREEGIPFREDSSNGSTKYFRNRIRLGIIPRIREVAPHFTDTMTANVERLTEAQKFIDRGIDLIRSQAVRVRDDRFEIDTEAVDPLLPQRFVLFELLQRYGFKGDVIDALHRSLKEAGCGKRFYSKDYVAHIDRSRIIVMPIPEQDACSLEVTADTRRVYCGGAAVTFEHLEIDDLDSLQVGENQALIDEDKIRYPLTVRRWCEGDFFVPFGMTGRKKVSDYLIDSKVSVPDKRRQFVVVSGGEILWIVGRRADERFRLGARTEKVLRITREAE